MNRLFLFVLLLASALTAQNWLRVDSVFSLSGVSVKNFSCPIFCDIDGDADLDLFLGNNADEAEFFRNRTGNGVAAYFSDTSVLGSVYWGGMQFANGDYPFLCDLDADGDSDMVMGGYNGIIYYKNAGTTSRPVWERVDTVFTAVNGDIGSDARPVFADIDADGDYDLFVGTGESLFGGPDAGLLFGYRNTGSRTNPRFSRDLTLTSGVADCGLNAYPAFADLNNDGDLDLLLGRDLATFYYYVNNGSRTEPQWVMNTTLFSGVESATYWKNPTLTDIDRDGDYDLIYGTDNGKLYTYENRGTPAAALFAVNTNYFKVLKLDGNGATVCLYDYDRDGDADLLSGIWTGKFQYFRNEGSSAVPLFRLFTAPFSNINPGSYSFPVFVDIDLDGDADIVSGNLGGTLKVYMNNNGSFLQNTGILASVAVSGFSAPAFADLDADGDADLLVGAEQAPNWKFLRNDGNGVFTAYDSLFTGIVPSNYARPSFADVDRDGDYDLLVGRIDGSVTYYRNTGTRQKPQWSLANEVTAGIKVKQNASPACADLDADGRPDLIAGEYDGNFTYYKNLFAPSSAAEAGIPADFLLEQNYPNPFNPETVLRFTVPARGTVKLFVTDLLGRVVVTLADGVFEAGTHSVVCNLYGTASGVYYATIAAGGKRQSIKMLYLK